jgi:hypothetical protein
MGDTGKAHILDSKPQRKRSFGRHGRRWKQNIKIDFKEIKCEGVKWAYGAQDSDQ